MDWRDFLAPDLALEDLNLLHARAARTMSAPVVMELREGRTAGAGVLRVRSGSGEPLSQAQADDIAGILAAWGPAARAEELALRELADWRLRLAAKHAGKAASQLADADLLEWARCRMAEDLGLEVG